MLSPGKSLPVRETKTGELLPQQGSQRVGCRWPWRARHVSGWPAHSWASLRCSPSVRPICCPSSGSSTSPVADPRWFPASTPDTPELLHCQHYHVCLQVGHSAVVIKFPDFPPTFQVNIYKVSTLATVAIQNEMHVISHCNTHIY